jgi:phospholipase C
VSDSTRPSLSHLKHLVIVMMSSHSFDHMLGALKTVNPAIDGLTGNESNPDTTGARIMVQAKARYQGQLTPDPVQHFAAVNT